MADPDFFVGVGGGGGGGGGRMRWTGWSENVRDYKNIFGRRGGEGAGGIGGNSV